MKRVESLCFRESHEEVAIANVVDDSSLATENEIALLEQSRVSPACKAGAPAHTSAARVVMNATLLASIARADIYARLYS